MDSSDHLATVLQDVPALVIPCQIGRLDPSMPQGVVAGAYGSILPAVWSFMLAARSRGLGTAWTTLHSGTNRSRRTAGHPRRTSARALTPVASYTGATSARLAVAAEKVTYFKRLEADSVRSARSLDQGEPRRFRTAQRRHHRRRRLPGVGAADPVLEALDGFGRSSSSVEGHERGGAMAITLTVPPPLVANLRVVVENGQVVLSSRGVALAAVLLTCNWCTYVRAVARQHHRDRIGLLHVAAGHGGGRRHRLRRAARSCATRRDRFRAGRGGRADRLVRAGALGRDHPVDVVECVRRAEEACAADTHREMSARTRGAGPCLVMAMHWRAPPASRQCHGVEFVWCC